MACVKTLTTALSRLLRPERLAEERLTDLLLGRRGGEDDDSISGLEPRVAVGVEDLAVPHDRADVRVGPLAAGLELGASLVRGGVDDDGAELLLDPERPAPVALDDHHLVPRLEERLREVVADLATAGDDEVHQRSAFATVGTSAESSSSWDIAAFMRFGPIVLSPFRVASSSVPRIVVRENV